MLKYGYEPPPQRYWDDMRWAREHSTELHQRFGEDSPYGGGIWVAIHNKKVVAWGTNLAEVEKQAAERTGVSAREIPLKFIESATVIYDQPVF